ncbi:MAG: 3-oxoacid CoA-transferase subunit B [Candidatus Binatia bacterium]
MKAAELKSRLTGEQIAWRVAQALEEGWHVNLGIGIPLHVVDYIPEGREVILHSENGILGMGARAAKGKEDPDLVNAGKEPVTLRPGGCFFSQAESFAMVRGGHIDVAVMGGLQVSQKGDLANWMIPEQELGNVGGAMDLAAGAREIWTAMEHCTKKGQPKILKECAYALTAQRCVKRIFTDIAVIQVTEQGLSLAEVAPGWTFEDVQELTEAKLLRDKPPKTMDLAGAPQ